MIRSKDYHQYTNYDYEPGGLRKLDYIVEVIRKSFGNNPKETRILDAACGKGDISSPLAYLGYQVTALAAQEEEAKGLKEKHQFNNLQAKTDSFENYLPQNRFEIIIMSEFLEHAKDPKAVLKKARKMLRHNGLLILTVPNGLSLEESIRKVTASAAKNPHLQFWSLFSLRSLMLSAGFEIAEIKSAAFLFKETYSIFVRFFLKRGSLLFHWFDKMDSRISRFVPPILASGWFITAKRKE
ncbi:MAG: hypothetical protein COY66_05505 [Candidatus Kerfeldbacteria bacterium CG_4_10_14_0_8_um_filter_42_10]|uniref:Methyltransferase domain-containing protein n=1 Tax=Candidatus Kerfeldbacteria bacterium CG_4_10_14_0_8_um_filter_42_10 TaxID=2014248 RepID=A0A2M7RGV9_9BACT|nr:MAG: hypothetical protein COY66_05505 [Candidatus Kerfeldbacteria bacterium CG_4_10_14_0_8_um_filter_42_10]